MQTAFALLCTISGAMAIPSLLSTHQPEYCGTPLPSQSFLEEVQRLRDGSLTLLALGNSLNTTNATSIDVNVYMHVITDTEDQRPSNASVEGQMTVLSSSYAPYNIRFNHVNTSYTADPRWASGTWMTFYSEAAPELRRGSFQDLNLYILSGMFDYFLPFPRKVYGLCHFPNHDQLEEQFGEDLDIVDCHENDKKCERERDGCIIDLNTLPGVSSDNIFFETHNRGKVAVHETGHWLGLLHPFSQDATPESPGSCTGTYGELDDLVDDTPVQAQITQGCPKEQDSCPKQPGNDSIHNYMDYSDDTCMNEFTPGQVKRMHELFELHRRGR